MKCYGLIGYPLSHSFSGKYFSEKFSREGISDCTYDLFPIERIDLLLPLINGNMELLGLNVTIPYKEQVIPYLNDIDEDAANIGAVNTIRITHNSGKTILKGYNTDVYGFSESLRPLLTQRHKNALILGTGGASKAVAYALKKWEIPVTFVSRSHTNSNTITYPMITPEIIVKSKIIVNTSPLGMYPSINDCPDIPYELLTPDHILFDLIYNPQETTFMSKGRSKGSKVLNGLHMLHLQADKAWQIWNTKSKK